MKNDFIKRNSMLDRLDYHLTRNIFCEKKDLTNEASVETFFVDRLIRDLGYKDNQIKTKQSIDSLTLAKGSKKYKYKPDYVLTYNDKNILVIDAKATNENINDYVNQCVHYCILLNKDVKTVKYFILSNGIKTALFSWDSPKAIIELDFSDFFSGGEKYEKFRKFVSINGIKINDEKEGSENLITLKKINKESAQKIFLSCHKYIWNTEKRGPLSAFTEFIKLIFVKLWNDRVLHENYSLNDAGEMKVPRDSNTFSVFWIETRENEILNPVNEILFKNLLEHIQDDIDSNNKKTIFDKDEKIKLKPTTIKGVAKKLEKIDLFGIDEDLNGRLFETFLNATMRGEALGQYFTPRSIVLLGTLIADLKVTDSHIDKVLDGSCGTGGFLIEALTIMRNIVRDNNSLSSYKKVNLIERISNESIYGIDAASEPNLARIARINMYLHGDGGSHIYFGDGLQKSIQIDKSDERLIQRETQNMKDELLFNDFDVVLTNPPFSMWYEKANASQLEILKEYELFKIEGTSQTRNRLRGSALFIERYYDLLKPGGKLISVIDETVLSSSQYSFVRDFIRERFIIKAIISLHGDAFQMAKARVKTALIYLIKKESIEDVQPSAFMYSSVSLGIDDLPITTQPSIVNRARKKAEDEIELILSNFLKFKQGEKGIWSVPANRLTDRLDVKSCIPLQGRFNNKWEESGIEVTELKNLLTLQENIIKPKADYPEKEFRILTITYNGECKAEEVRKGKNINYSKMKVLKEGDLVFSEYNLFNGAVGYVTSEIEGALASNSYTVIRCNNQIDSLYLWSIMRTTEIRADFLTSAIGMGRQTISWESIREVKVPLLNISKRKEISESIFNAWEYERIAKSNIESVFETLNSKLDVESEESIKRFEASKPPK